MQYILWYKDTNPINTFTNDLSAKRQNSGQLGDLGGSRLILGHERIERQIVVLLLG